MLSFVFILRLRENFIYHEKKLRLKIRILSVLLMIGVAAITYFSKYIIVQKYVIEVSRSVI